VSPVSACVEPRSAWQRNELRPLADVQSAVRAARAEVRDEYHAAMVQQSERFEESMRRTRQSLEAASKLVEQLRDQVSELRREAGAFQRKLNRSADEANTAWRLLQQLRSYHYDRAQYKASMPWREGERDGAYDLRWAEAVCAEIFEQAHGCVGTARTIVQKLTTKACVKGMGPVLEGLDLGQSEDLNTLDEILDRVKEVVDMLKPHLSQPPALHAYQVICSIFGSLAARKSRMRALIRRRTGLGHKGLDKGRARYAKAVAEGAPLYDPQKAAYRNNMYVRYPELKEALEEAWRGVTAASPHAADVMRNCHLHRHSFSKPDKNGHRHRLCPKDERTDKPLCPEAPIHYLSKTYDEAYVQALEVLPPHLRPVVKKWLFISAKPWYIRRPTLRTCACPHHKSAQYLFESLREWPLWRLAHAGCGGGVEGAVACDCKVCEGGACQKIFNSRSKLQEAILCPPGEGGVFHWACATGQCPDCGPKLMEVLKCPLLADAVAAAAQGGQEGGDGADVEEEGDEEGAGLLQGRDGSVIKVKMYVKESQQQHDPLEAHEPMWGGQQGRLAVSPLACFCDGCKGEAGECRLDPEQRPPGEVQIMQPIVSNTGQGQAMRRDLTAEARRVLTKCEEGDLLCVYIPTGNRTGTALEDWYQWGAGRWTVVKVAERPDAEQLRTGNWDRECPTFRAFLPDEIQAEKTYTFPSLTPCNVGGELAHIIDHRGCQKMHYIDVPFDCVRLGPFRDDELRLRPDVDDSDSGAPEPRGNRRLSRLARALQSTIRLRRGNPSSHTGTDLRPALHLQLPPGCMQQLEQMHLEFQAMYGLA
jgi:hypothetical protein